MSLATLRSKVILAHQFNHGTNDSAGKNAYSVNNGATAQHVKVGDGAFYFDGSTDYIATGVTPVDNDSFTFLMWVKCADATAGGTYPVLMSTYNGDGAKLAFRTDTGNIGKLYFQIDGTSIISPLTYDDDAWHLVTGTYDYSTGTHTLYVDGSSVISGSVSTVTHKHQILFGDENVGDSNKLQGYLDQGIYLSEALSQTQIDNIYNQGFGRKYSELDAATKANCEAAYEFNLADVSGTSITDLSGNGNTATNSGATHNIVKTGTGAMLFDGIDDNIDTGQKMSSGRTEFSYAARFYATDLSINRAVGGEYNGAGDRAFLVSVRDTNEFQVLIGDYGGNIVNYISTDSPITINSWHSIIWTFDNGAVYIYLDGSLVHSDTTTLSANLDSCTKNTYIGQREDGENYFEGYIDSTYYFGEALTSTEVTELYNSGDGLELFPRIMDGQVAYWKFDGDATDATQNGNDLTVVGATQTSSGKINEAYELNGSSDYLYAADTSVGDFGADENFSVSAWIYCKGDTFGEIFNKRKTTSDYNGYYVHYSDSTNSLNFTIDPGSNSSVSISGPAISLNTWYHVACTRNGTTMTLLQDGVEENATTDSTIAYDLSNTNTLKIGTYRAATANFFDGDIDEPAIWNRSLESYETTFLYADGAPTSEQQWDYTEVPTPGGDYYIKVWTGSAFESKPIKVWAGSSFESKPVSVWNGSAWVELPTTP